MDEIIIGVSIALTGTPADEAPSDEARSFDATCDGTVTVDEVVRTVKAALVGCVSPLCANGHLDGAESCDDGYDCDGDGCDSRCYAERGYECAGEPSICVLDFGLIYALNELDGSLSVLATDIPSDTSAGTTEGMDRITVAGVPRDVDLSRDGRIAYVTSRSPDILSVIDTTSRTTVSTIREGIGRAPEGVACSPRGDEVYVASVDDGAVALVDTSVNQVTQVIPVGERPTDLAVTPNGRYVYVTNFILNGTVSTIDTRHDVVVSTISVEEFPSTIAVTPDGRYAWVANFVRGSVSIIDTTNQQVVSTVYVHVVIVDGVLVDRSLPTGIAFSPDGLQAYVTNFGSDTVFVLDTRKALTEPAEAFIHAIEVDPFPTSVKVHPRGTLAFVTNFVRDARGFPIDGMLAILDTAAGRVTDRIPVGKFALRLAVGPPPDALTPRPTMTFAPQTHTPTPLPNCGAVSCATSGRCAIDVNCHQLGGDCSNLDRCLPEE